MACLVRFGPLPYSLSCLLYLRRMSLTLAISPAAARDIPDLVALVNRAYRGEASRRGWTTEAHLLDGLRTDENELGELLATPNVTLLMARDTAGQLLGSVYLEIKRPDLYLGMLSVDPDQQAHGIGRQLLAAAEAYARQTGCTGVLISVISVRTELIAWYERLGFQPTGETVPFPEEAKLSLPKQELALLLMRKML